MKDTDGPAFPVQAFVHPNGEVQYGDDGMTLRDYFAGQALAGYYSDPELAITEKSIAIGCYSVADAMIAERNKVGT